MKKIVIAVATIMAGCATAGSLPAKTDGQTAHSEAPTSGLVTQPTVAAFNPNLVSFKSDNNFEDTLAALKSSIDARGFKTFAVIDHAKGAASIGQTLRPTTLIIFGNPQGGTPLMLSAQTMGIALPLKALVYETAEGEVMLAVTDIERTLSEHGVTDRDPVKQKVSSVLSDLATESTAALSQ